MNSVVQFVLGEFLFLHFYEDYVCDSVKTITVSYIFSEEMWNWTYTQTPKKRKEKLKYIRFCSLGLSSSMNEWMNGWYCGHKTSETKPTEKSTATGDEQLFFPLPTYFTVFCLMAYLRCWSRKVCVIPWQSLMVCASVWVYLIKV